MGKIKNNEKLKELLGQYKIFVVLILVILIFGMISPRFLTVSNFSNIIKQIAANAILAAGMCFVILTGGIDISVGAILAFTSAITVWMTANGCNIFVVLLTGIFIGAVIGSVNGIFVAKFNLQPMIVTLATQSIFRGATLVFTKGSPIPLGTAYDAPIYKWFGSGMVFGVIPVPLIIVVIVFAVSFYLLNRTSFGRHVYAVGGNEDAALLSGIQVIWTKIRVYVVCGIMAAVAGIIISSRISSAQPTAGETYEMDAIAAVVIGGTSLRGGEGQVLFTIVGAIIIGMLNNLLNLMGVESYYQTIVKGVVILIAVLIDAKSVRK